MRPHVGAKTLARYRQGDLTDRRSARIGAHLAGCARCRARSEDLAGVTTLLASVKPPPIPQHLTARIQAALATEAAMRAARPGETARPEPARPGEKPAAVPAPAGTGPGRTGPAGTGPAANGHHPPRETPRPGRRPRLPRLGSPVALRALAAAAAVVLLAGGVYELTQHGASSTSSSAGSSAAAPEVPAPASQSRGALGAGLALPYQHAGGQARITAVMSGTDYTPANLGGQVAATLARSGRSAPTAGPKAAGPERTRSPATASGGQADTFGGIPVPALAGCVSRIAAGGRVLLVDVARYQGEPATIIVTRPAAGGPEQIWVVGPGCSASRSDLLHHAEAGTAG
jgi:hypothetical protein